MGVGGEVVGDGRTATMSVDDGAQKGEDDVGGAAVRPETSR